MEKTRKRYDVRVWFEDGSRITVCNINAGNHSWSRANAKNSAQLAASQRRYNDRGGIRAVAIARSFELPSSRS